MLGVACCDGKGSKGEVGDELVWGCVETVALMSRCTLVTGLHMVDFLGEEMESGREEKNGRGFLWGFLLNDFSLGGGM